MTQVRIIHNPFTVETAFTLDGIALTEGTRLHRCTSLRLQTWVETLFDELSAMVNGQDVFDVTFVGVEPDFRDVEEAASLARDKGMTINLSWEPAASAEARQESLDALRHELLQHPGYQSILQDDAATSRVLLEAASQDFDVYVVATMSSGKSSLINAMLGRDLLPYGNEATTATITRIYQDDELQKGLYRGTRYNKLDDVLETCDDVDLATMRRWNQDAETYRIELRGHIMGADGSGHGRLVLTDTPGPNNSGDREHNRITMEYIQDAARNPLILYVLNATQQGIEDDSRLLNLVAQYMKRGGKQSSDRFIFVVNKMDALDAGSGDDAAGLLARTRSYLQRHGIEKPQILPVSAFTARMVRLSDEVISGKERSGKAGHLEWFGSDPAMELPKYVQPRAGVSAALAKRDLSDLERRTGLPLLECTVAAYVQKYHLPDRFKRSHDAVLRLTAEAINRQKGLEELASSDLQALAVELANLQERYRRGSDGQALAAQIAQQRLDLPLEVERELVGAAADIKAMVRDCLAEFEGEVSPAKARALISKWRDQLEFAHNRAVNQFEQAFDKGQTAIKANLQEQYAMMMEGVVDEAEALKFPALARMMKSAARMTFDFELQDSHKGSRPVVNGSKRVPVKKWYDPFAWFSSTEEKTYGTQSYVDLSRFKESELVDTLTRFSRLDAAARKAIEDGRATLVAAFVAHAKEVLGPRVEELFAEANARIDDKHVREEALVQATEMRRWSEGKASELQAILSVEEAAA